jgi:hypothetical protein
LWWNKGGFWADRLTRSLKEGEGRGNYIRHLLLKTWGNLVKVLRSAFICMAALPAAFSYIAAYMALPAAWFRGFKGLRSGQIVPLAGCYFVVILIYSCVFCCCYSIAQVMSDICKVGAAIEAALGSAQDIEGVVDPDGNIHVVQTRPQV